MAYEEKNYGDDNGGLYSIFKLMTILVRKWWLILLLLVAFAAAGFIAAKATYTESYASKLSFNVLNKNEDLVSSQKIISSSDAQASVTLANNFKYVLMQSNDFISSVQEIVRTKTGSTYSKAYLHGCMSVNVITDCTVVEVKVTTGDAELAYAIATAIQSAYEPITEKTFPTASFTVLDSASAAELQGDSSVIIYTTAAALVGACIAVVMILITERLRNTLLSSDDIKKSFNIDVLATVAKIKQSKTDKNHRVLITDRSVGLPFIETFKLIRTKLENVKLKKGYSVFAITSSTESEGKTTCSTNIALSLAKSGKAVLLIDADLRKPAVYKALGIPVGEEKDVFDIVAGRKTFEEAVKYVEKYNLYLLISGSPVSDPSEILASHNMESIIKEAKKSFDYVIIDCPPAGVVADAAIIANYTDAIVFVAAENNVSLRQIEYALSDLMTTKSDILGCIYNCANTHLLPVGNERSSGYFSGGYGHYYGGYGNYGTSYKKKH